MPATPHHATTHRLPSSIIGASESSFEDNLDLIEDGKVYDPNWARHRLDCAPA